jgi:hypothetical protein
MDHTVLVCMSVLTLIALSALRESVRLVFGNSISPGAPLMNA